MDDAKADVAFEQSPVESKVETTPVKPVVEEKDDEAKRFIVSDATWEERTWKEIVRLREDMFWARVGGVRS